MRFLLLSLLTTATVMAMDLSLDPEQWHRPAWNTNSALEKDADGAAMLRITTPTADWNSALVQTLVFTSDIATVDISWSMRTKEVVGGTQSHERARIQLQWLDAQGVMVGGWPECRALAGDQPWTPFTQSFRPPASTRAVTIMAGMYLATGTAWIRELRLTARDAAGKEIAQASAKDLATDTTGWWTATPPTNTQRVIGLDLGLGKPRPTSATGKVSVRDGRLTFADGTPAHFWGSGYAHWDGEPADQIRALDRLASMGCNMVRLHGIESGVHGANLFVKGSDRSEIDPTRLDRLQQFIAACGERGIYVMFDCLVGWQFRSGDGVRDYQELTKALAGKPVMFFDERINHLLEEYLAKVLGSVNPHNGRRLADDPTLALVGLINECSIVDPHQWRVAPDSYRVDARRRFDAWASEQKVSAPSGGIIELLEKNDPLVRRFLFGLQNAWYARVAAQLHKLGVTVPLTGTNWQAHAGEMAASAKLGFIDRHFYWDHPSDGWDATCTFWNSPLSESLGHGDKPGMFADLASQRVAGVPYTISEWNNVWSNEYVTEGSLLMSSIGAYQAADALLVFGVDGSGWQPTMKGAFSLDEKPHALIPWIASGIAYRRGDVRPGPEVVFPLDPTATKQVGEVIPAGLALSNRIGWKEGAPAPKIPAHPAPPDSSVAGSTCDAADGQFRWQAPGRFILDTARTQAAVGLLGGAVVKTAALTIATETPWCQVLVTSLDGKPLASSARMLLVTSARTENTQQVYRLFRRGLTDLGHAPIVVEPVRGSLTLRRTGGAPVVYALDLDGYRTGAKLPAERVGDGWRIVLDGSPAMWYEVVAP